MDAQHEPLAVIKRFHEAENVYMNAGGAAAGTSFAAIAATLDPEVVLHQSPDLPWGGEFRATPATRTGRAG